MANPVESKANFFFVFFFRDFREGEVYQSGRING